jgi:acetyltransferase-like isoleucine patch superfamily enzyme
MDERLQYVESFMYPNNGRSVVNFEDGSFTTIYVTDEVKIGVGAAMDPSIQVGTPDRPLSKFIVGDHSRLFAGQILPRNFVCGDYVTIHEGVWCYGREDVIIGHNSWFGMRCTLDAEGGFRVGNGFGAGQDTHLWSHIRHGDVIQGSKYISFGQFSADDDVWFVGRCTSAPAHHESWSVALTESNVVKGMKSNHVYGGNPAVDLTDKIGAPYEPLTLRQKEERFSIKVEQFAVLYVNGTGAENDFQSLVSSFNVEKRTYRKTNTALEAGFMRFLLPEAKFVPEDQPVVSL